MATATGPDGLYEVVGDQVVETALGAYECWLANVMAEFLINFTRGPRLGRVLVEVLFDLHPAVDRQRRPDLAFLSEARWPRDRPAPRTSAWAVVPDLAVEIASESNSATEIMGKVEEYFQAGVERAWVLFPDQGKLYDYGSPTTVQILTAADTLDGGALLPGFQLPLGQILADPGRPAP